MAQVHRAAFMQFRKKLEEDRKPIRHADFEALKSAVVSALESTGEIVVNKVRRTTRPGVIFEATCQWTGIDPDPENIARVLRDAWPGKTIPRDDECHIIEPETDHVTILFAATAAEKSHFVTGRVHVEI